MKETLKPGLQSDGIDIVSKGIHERFVIDAQTFIKKIAKKATQKVSS